MPPPIRFYLEEKIPSGIETAWDAYQAAANGLLRSGVNVWTVQTFLNLRGAGMPCELTNTLPTDGILVAHRKSIPRNFIPPPGMLFVCLRADATFHPYAHWHVVQNRCALNHWYPAVYLPHWPQPGLLPRDPERGDAWENAVFSGDPGCIAHEMQGAGWDETLREFGLRWNFFGPEKWHDFRETDVVVAVRGFDRHRHTNKPPTKLFNAWHAGVPAILGRESAYEQERKDPLDFIEVHSFPEVIAALRRLTESPELRRAMREHGFQRATESHPAVITAKWREFLENTVIPAYESARGSGSWSQAWFRANGRIKTAAQDLQQRFWR